MKEVEDANADFIVDDSTELLLAAYERIGTFCKCLPMSLPISCHVTAHSMEINGLHAGVKGMLVGGKRRLLASAAYAFTREELRGFISESVADL